MPKTYFVAINVEDENRYEATSDLALAIEVALGEKCVVEAVVFENAEHLLDAAQSEEQLFMR
ncbi:hypothetical protein [Rhizobium leguminosarum]|uniref:hypothetical protein n=1 Tax=Rhizobium leguminosarum TaxID=384 RepID=UPI002E15777F|nr:hypothetical protein U8Q02_42610 [Rhizobium leguminosarum]